VHGRLPVHNTLNPGDAFSALLLIFSGICFQESLRTLEMTQIEWHKSGIFYADGVYLWMGVGVGRLNMNHKGNTLLRDSKKHWSVSKCELQ
jgi:hypothetical protein